MPSSIRKKLVVQILLYLQNNVGIIAFLTPVMIACFIFRGNVFLFTLVRPEYRLVMLVGNCTVWNMEFNQMDKCPQINLLGVGTIHSTHFSVKLGQENMFLELCLLI